MESFVVTQCPHCQGTIIVQRSEINCAIFRHAVYRATLQPINPHAAKVECDQLVEQNQVWGCAKPFRLMNDVAVACEYI